MAEKEQTEMLSSLAGERGQEAMQMLRRMQRLQRLMGTTQPKEMREVAKKQEAPELFARNRNENMIFAAIPFLNREYQRDLYLIVRLMELRRVLGGGVLETRERQEEPPRLRQKKLLQAVEPYVSEQERRQLHMFMKMIDMKDILGQGE